MNPNQIIVKSPAMVSMKAIWEEHGACDEMVFRDGGRETTAAALIRAEAALSAIMRFFEAQLAAANPDHLAQCPACAALLAVRNSKVLDALEKPA